MQYHAGGHGKGSRVTVEVFLKTRRTAVGGFVVGTLAGSCSALLSQQAARLGGVGVGRRGSKQRCGSHPWVVTVVTLVDMLPLWQVQGKRAPLRGTAVFESSSMNPILIPGSS